MKKLQYALGILLAMCCGIALIVGSVELTAFGSLSFYEKQYSTLEVYDDVGMTLPDLMVVTQEMLKYLQGDRDDLVVETTMYGTQREFFNEKEKLHMVDVRNLNLGAVKVAKSCCVIAALCLILMAFLHLRRKAPVKELWRCLAQTFLVGTVTFLLLMGAGALLVSSDFDRYWKMFHYIFFTNDLWLLDPTTDMLINIVPGEFFQAFIIRCAVIFVSMILALTVLCIVVCVRTKSVVPSKRSRNAKGHPLLTLLLGGSMLLHSLTLAPVHAEASGSDTDSSNPELVQQRLDNIPSGDRWPQVPEVQGSAAILWELNTDTILFAKNALQSAYPASTTKILTALLTIEQTSPEDTVIYSSKAVLSLPQGASHIGLKVGEVLSVYDSLCGLLLPSANEVANGLAELVSGSIPAFVTLMNTRAAELGAVNTHFSNANGLHQEEHTTCAYDLAKLYQACLEQPLFVEISSKSNYIIGETNLINETRPMRTTHRMMRKDDEYYMESVVCGKTGTTDEAGGCLITYAEQGDLALLCVVLGAEVPAQYEDTTKLLQYGFENFSQVNVAASDSRFQGDIHSTELLSAGNQLQFYEFDSRSVLLLPNELSLSDLTTNIVKNIDGDYSKIQYYYQDQLVGEADVLSATLSFQDYNSQLTGGESGADLPYLSLPAMVAPKLHPIWIILPSCLGVTLVVAIFLGIYHNNTNTQRRRRKRTQVFHNVWRDHL